MFVFDDLPILEKKEGASLLDTPSLYQLKSVL